MPSQFGGIPVEENIISESKFGGVPLNEESLSSKYYSGELTDEHKAIAEELERRGKIKLGVPQWGIEHPNLYGAYGAFKPLLHGLVRPAVETVGTIGGGILATPETLGSGTLLGGAFGYAISSKGMDIIEDLYKKIGEEPLPVRTIKGEALDIAFDMGMTYALGKGLELGESVLWAADKYLFEKLPERLYASATKMPLSKKWTQILPRRQLTKRQIAVSEGLATKTPPSEFGAAKAESLENEVKNYIDDVVSILDENPENVINVEEILERGLKRAYAHAERSSDPIGAKSTVDDIAERFRAHGESLKPTQANQIKRQLYDEVKWGGTETTAVQSQVISKAKKGIAHELMKNLEKIYPELKTLNQKDAARIYLKEAIERAAGREMNNNMIKLGPKILLRPKTWPLALFDATIGHPQVKARIAFALAKANPTKYSQFIYPEMPRGYTPSAKDLSKELEETFNKERLRYLDQKFEDLARARAKGNIGMPLLRPKTSYEKSIIPQKPKVTIREPQPMEYVPKQQPLRPDQLSVISGKNELTKKELDALDKGVLPLLKPKEEFIKSTRPKTVEEILDEINKRK